MFVISKVEPAFHPFLSVHDTSLFTLHLPKILW